MYVCLEACKAGFISGCRPILGVDGCHLKGLYLGMLLVVVGKDGNCNIYPFAWAIVEVENIATWIWLLELLMKDLQALGEAFKQCFWKIAKAYTKEEFEKYMAEMKEMTVPGFTYLNSIPTKHWARHAFSTKCNIGMMLNNCCESFNNVLRKCRDTPVLELLEWIRRYNMTRIWSKIEGASKLEGNLRPSVIKQLGIVEKEYRHCRTEQSGPHEYEVEYNLDKWIVDLEKRTCN
ncbi:uncharacterized protein LOC141627688 [Silene latifolia]|uniref:uncharacterized protein LOC141627688 n=1 Tax=Silene latifolia TaxID=37657 RepID=UPI003D786D8C